MLGHRGALTGACLALGLSAPASRMAVTSLAVGFSWRGGVAGGLSLLEGPPSQALLDLPVPLKSAGSLTSFRKTSWV